MGKLALKVLLISFISILLLIFLYVLIVNIHEQRWISVVKKWSNVRIENFLTEYQKNSQQALKKYRLEKGPEEGYRNYKIELKHASYNGDPDVNVQVIHKVTLYYSSKTLVYRVEQVFTFVDEPTKSAEKNMSNVRNWFMEWAY